MAVTAPDAQELTGESPLHPPSTASSLASEEGVAGATSRPSFLRIGTPETPRRAALVAAGVHVGQVVEDHPPTVAAAPAPVIRGPPAARGVSRAERWCSTASRGRGPRGSSGPALRAVAVQCCNQHSAAGSEDGCSMRATSWAAVIFVSRREAPRPTTRHGTAIGAASATVRVGRQASDARPAGWKWTAAFKARSIFWRPGFLPPWR